jgi:hypothetical protein
MEIIGFIILGVIIFVVVGILGWGLKGLGAIFGFLTEGWWTCLGYVFLIFFIILLLLALV